MERDPGSEPATLRERRERVERELAAVEARLGILTRSMESRARGALNPRAYLPKSPLPILISGAALGLIGGLLFGGGGGRSPKASAGAVLPRESPDCASSAAGGSSPSLARLAGGALLGALAPIAQRFVSEWAERQAALWMERLARR